MEVFIHVNSPFKIFKQLNSSEVNDLSETHLECQASIFQRFDSMINYYQENMLIHLSR